MVSKRNINYVFLFLTTHNFNLIKEPGMIPNYFNRIFNFNGTILTYKNGEYPFLEKYCSSLKLDFIRKSKHIQSFEINVLKYLIMKAKRIDFLNLIFPSYANFFYGFFYKLLNKKGFVYLKMDIHELFKQVDLFQRHRENTNFHGTLKMFHFYVRKKIIEFFFKKVDLISAESKELVSFLIKKYPNLSDKIIYIPNGVDDYFLENSGIQKIPLHKRENIILNVGRIGTHHKCSEILMEAVAKLKDLKDWKVIYVGSIDEKFQKIREEFFRKHPDLKDKILFIGEVRERKEINEIYQKAKIFCLTSILGSFEITLVEALSNGDYIVSSNLPSAKDITKNGTLGTLYKRGDSDELSKILQKIIDDDNFLKAIYPHILEYAEENYYWSKIIRKLFREMVKRKTI
jgi:glycosyltransferase involved in cell wall biosynthesis